MCGSCGTASFAGDVLRVLMIGKSSFVLSGLIQPIIKVPTTYVVYRSCRRRRRSSRNDGSDQTSASAGMVTDAHGLSIKLADLATKQYILKEDSER